MPSILSDSNSSGIKPGTVQVALAVTRGGAGAAGHRADRVDQAQVFQLGCGGPVLLRRQWQELPGMGIGQDPVPIHVSGRQRSEEHTSELQSRGHLVCRLLLEKKKTNDRSHISAGTPYT